ncbi:uncharacterized protein PADG_12350 [Paracoccidioides brasiliensis Pb18]|uniref:Uncharacterized protein n=1 Tax=Paracoccidioides brasiliensis (strain Pb18) TaxID=502780 RepID=A0A0A0HVW3_PARBD|nr:uncharacterized protein PADG_12350 [Paracoccidioides brasiliensis Pb18]KGM91575.1 hypothetical protein PADG_12350 [Paracoccidioides brasiliensis Pb18]
MTWEGTYRTSTPVRESGGIHVVPDRWASSPTLSSLSPPEVRLGSMEPTIAPLKRTAMPRNSLHKRCSNGARGRLERRLGSQSRAVSRHLARNGGSRVPSLSMGVSSSGSNY